MAGSVHDLKLFLGVWISTAAVALLLSALETIFRVRRVHSGLALEMIQAAAEQFLPSIVVGLLLTVVLLRIAPQDSWMLPGLWEAARQLGDAALAESIRVALLALPRLDPATDRRLRAPSAA